MKGNEKSHLTPRQLQVIPHILASPSYEEAARRAQITPKQIHEWLQDPLFKTELDKRRTEAYCHAISHLKISSTKAVEALDALLQDKDSRVRLSAADKILAHVLKGVEYLGFEERLLTLENQVTLALKAGNKK